MREARKQAREAGSRIQKKTKTHKRQSREWILGGGRLCRDLCEREEVSLRIMGG